MPEPVSITLGSIGLFIKSFDAFKRTYNGYKLTATFGTDFEKSERRFSILHTRLETISKTKLSWLQDDIIDEDSELKKAIVNQLVLINNDYEVCTGLIQKYHEKEKTMEDESKADSQGQPSDRELAIENGATNLDARNTKENKKKKSKSATSSILSFLHLKKSKKKKKFDGGPAWSQPLTPNDSVQMRVQTPNAGPGTSNSTSARTPSQTQSSDELTVQGPTTTPSSTTLSSRAVVKETAMLDENATRLKEASNLWYRIKWQDHDRETFLERLTSLREHVKDLEDLIQLQVPHDSSMFLMQANAWPERSQDELIQLALKRLHDALASVNLRTSVVTFGVQVLEDPEKQADEFSSEGSLSFEPGSFMFVLQVHLPKDSQARSLFLYTETLGPTTSHGRHTQKEDLRSLSDIGGTVASLEIEDASGDYRSLGYVDRSRSSPDCHHLYSPATGPWLSSSTLQTYLNQSEYKDDLTKQQRFRIARLLTISFIHFAKVVNATDQYPRPDRIRYYIPDGSTDTWLSASKEPNILNPFVTLGFGMQKPVILPGTSSGLSKQTINPVVELGLVLYQIGSGTNLEYGSGDIGVKNAKEVAMKAMNQVDKLSNGSFSEIVQLCLGWRGNICAPAERPDYVFIDRVRQWLKLQEHKTNV